MLKRMRAQGSDFFHNSSFLRQKFFLTFLETLLALIVTFSIFLALNRINKMNIFNF